MKRICLTAVLAVASFSVSADQVIFDDLIVTNSMCVGADCVDGEEFEFSTLKIKGDDPLVLFQDTSVSASFPTNDWSVGIGLTGQGGAPQFVITDVSGSADVVTLESGNNPGVALGAGAAVVPGAISFGDSGSERRVSYVADGVDDTDAATKGQLDARVVEINANFAAEIDQAAAALEGDIDALMTEIAALTAQLNDLQTALDN